jgi:hypothetical protein
MIPLFGSAVALIAQWRQLALPSKDLKKIKVISTGRLHGHEAEFIR